MAMDLKLRWGAGERWIVGGEEDYDWIKEREEEMDERYKKMKEYGMKTKKMNNNDEL